MTTRRQMFAALMLGAMCGLVIDTVIHLLGK
jgi:hypothetical protein